MEITTGARILSSTHEEAGKVGRLVLDPRSKEVTHLVIEANRFPRGKLLPAAYVVFADQDKVILDDRISDLNDLTDFEAPHYVTVSSAELLPGTRGSIGGAYYQYPPVKRAPVGFSDRLVDARSAEMRESHPENLVALKEGAPVVSADQKKVGKVKSLIIDPEDQEITHVVIEQGLLLKSAKIIPVTWIDFIDEAEVHLAVGKEQVESLADYDEADDDKGR